jgi:hypothetical protein
MASLHHLMREEAFDQHFLKEAVVASGHVFSLY